ncbi:DNA polymerase-1 [Desulfobaculum xiamenense]|uniref:DNA polymerase I n=1 Tax=Desulfobaculum xiamenense TaxID=995050 RepID=A0A846QUC7_9BACT|nr:DNA polymerase I [Desulfobaculum xiamenense]NJB68249.1 DNA polymerase-1 [Desulfobaculum xiamenense]
MSLKDRLGFEQSPAFLIDGHAFAYRFYYAMRDMQRSDGFPTNALYLFLRMLMNLLRDEKPEYLGVFFDGKGPTFRHELYKPYKAQRPAMPEDLAMQLEPMRDAVRVLGLPLHVAEGVEADDCMASVAARVKAQCPVVIVGADKDLKQCLDDSVVLWDPDVKREKLTTIMDFRRDTGLEPAQWPDFQALIGDSADNIPGVQGIGPKSAATIMEQFPTLEALRDAIVEGKGTFTASVRRKLETGMNDAFLFRTLTTLSTEVCTGIDLAALAVKPPVYDEVEAFLAHYEFRTMLRTLPSYLPRPVVAPKPAPAPEPVPEATRPAASAAPAAQQLSLFGLAPAAPAAQPASVADAECAESAADSVTQGLCEPYVLREASEPRALPDVAGVDVGLVPTDEDGRWLVGIKGQEWAVCGTPAQLAEHLAAARRIAVPSVKDLLRADDAWRSLPAERFFDLGLACYLLSPEDRDYGWEHLRERMALEFLGMPMEGEARTAAAMAVALRGRLDAAHLSPLMSELEMPLIPVLADMEEAGIAIDTAALSAFLDEVQAELDALTVRIHERAGREFNIRSSQQMAEVLFTDLGLKPRGKTPGGLPSTAFEVLEKIRSEHPVVEDIQSWRKLEKMRSTYLEPLPRAADAAGRVHTSFNQLATATGRLSSSGPNLQNIPIRGDMGKRMRSCFTASEGNLLVAADYSQIELRVLAHFSEEPALVEAFRNGEDIHARTAALLFDRTPDAVEPDERRSAKTINFGLIYGMGPQKLAGELGISLKEAKGFIERYFERLSGLAAFYDAVEAQARTDGFVTTLAGRRRLLPDINSRNAHHQSQARRQAINTRIQGSAADIIKMAMLRAWRDEDLRSMGARLILQVHDELLIEAPRAVAERAGRRLEEIMTGIYDLSVPLVVDWGTGSNWGEAH